jgi:CRP-like cAMP-binding protein
MTQESSAFAADPNLIQELEKRSQRMPVAGMRVLFRQGDDPTGLYIVHKGEATLTMRSGDEIVMSVKACSGSLLGLPAVIGNEPYSLTAEASEGAELSFLSSAEFMKLMQSDPVLSLKLLQVLAAEVRAARKALSGL